MTITPDVTLIFSDVESMISSYTPEILGFLVVALSARIAMSWIHNALEHKTRF